MNVFTRIIANALSLPERGVENTLELLDENCTIPFISRYRKERTGNLDEVQVSDIALMREKLMDVAKRKETIVSTIEDAGKMTDELRKRIDECWNMSELEDIYLPYKPKRRTKADIARQQGLEPLAQLLLIQRDSNPLAAASKYVKGDVKTAEDAIQGAKYIIAETINENERVRKLIRSVFRREATITSKVVKTKAEEDDAQKYSDYFDFSEPLRRCSSHRLLAMRRGEKEGFLRISISADDDECKEKIRRQYVTGRGECSKLVGEAADDAFKRLLKPSIETEFALSSKQDADKEAIGVFTENLRQLLLAAPLGQKRVMGVDPGFRTGCKVVCLDAQGALLHFEAIYPHAPKNDRAGASRQVLSMVKKYDIEAIAVGNGTASRETSSFLKEIGLSTDIDVFVVSEDGASVYSASEAAREEFPDKDVTVRGAVSIGRRLMDPLAELVKIDPKSIGVGQYQHDVDQAELKKSLDMVVESCVNTVGVNLNTASRHLLMYVSGLNATTAKNIVEYRDKNGAFKSRAELKKVPRLGPVAYVQCAGFLRIPGAKNPLDNSAVHPESYDIVKAMAKDKGCTVAELIDNKELQKTIHLKDYVTDAVGMPTLNDIMAELQRPGRDPRAAVEAFEFDPRVHEVADLQVGMLLPGIVTNITNFGAFVDVGVHQDGLVHISQLADRYVKDPNEVVKLHQHVVVRVTDVDKKRQRISLSMRE
ncbi:Tex family protein [uncultured Prevotella sp.]|uniref:Tex family protein n=1 Tax=uncultured Prevotella sp. TaxID=159272 RepID=UPI0025F9269D|nr:Tex family protein [uncultured Prevotella sp.]